MHRGLTRERLLPGGSDSYADRSEDRAFGGQMRHLRCHFFFSCSRPFIGRQIPYLVFFDIYAPDKEECLRLYLFAGHTGEGNTSPALILSGKPAKCRVGVAAGFAADGGDTASAEYLQYRRC